MSAPLEWGALWAALDEVDEEAHDTWVETTEAMFYDQLCCVPPKCQARGTFLSGEPLRTNRDGDFVYHAFKAAPGPHFYARNMTEVEFRLEFL